MLPMAAQYSYEPIVVSEYVLHCLLVGDSPETFRLVDLLDY